MIINENSKVPKSGTIQEYQKQVIEKHYSDYKKELINQIKLIIKDIPNLNKKKYSSNKTPIMYMFIESNFDKLKNDLKDEGLTIQYSEDKIVKYKGLFKRTAYVEIIDRYYLITW